MAGPVLEMRSIVKTFPGVKALSDVTLTVRQGEVHAICGENGAGKSTLMKVLSGVHPHGSYEGDILFEGEECRFRDIRASEQRGIVIIHQELALVPFLSIAENIFLGNEHATRGLINWNETLRHGTELLRRVGLSDHPETRVADIGVGKQQLVEIAKALSKKVKLLILDEPTAALNDEDSGKLLDLILELKTQGITCIIISHKLNEIRKVADSVTILRDGRSIETLDVKAPETTEERIISGMVGRDLDHRFPERTPHEGEPEAAPALEIRGWTVFHPIDQQRKVVDDVSINVRRGEIVGIAGLMGAGRTELAMSVFGRAYGQRIRGEVLMHGKTIDVSTIQKAIGHGIAYVTEDRKSLGLLLEDDIRHNISLANLKAVSTGGIIDGGAEFAAAADYKRKLNIRCSSVMQQTVNLSGGNQQKVVLGKWLFSRPELLILDEPTRGIDVGAKFEIYSIMAALADEGKCILMISSEMPELLGMCDRIYVMNEGRFVGEFSSSEASQEKIMRAIVKQGLA
jgi:putative multiple sugar transport system ATP-binding protein